jgi:putative flippase GtrA
MSLPTLILRYSAFAVLATIANLGTQRMVLAVGHAPGIFPAALLAGTASGLVVKYLLDKRWIFHDHASGLRAHRERFARYSLMGVATTALFWGTETTCWLIWQSDALREIGAVIGLLIGYIAKYHLDRRFVFGLPANAA